MTSTSGVTLISLISALLARPRRRRPPEEPLFPIDMPMASNPAICFIGFRTGLGPRQFLIDLPREYGGELVGEAFHARSQFARIA